MHPDSRPANRIRRGGFFLSFLLKLVGIGVDGLIQCFSRFAFVRKLLKPADCRLILARLHRGMPQCQSRVSEFIRRILIILSEPRLFGGFFQLAFSERIHARRIAAILRPRFRILIHAETFVQPVRRRLRIRPLSAAPLPAHSGIGESNHRVANLRNQHELVARRLIFARTHQLPSIQIDAVLALCRRIAVIAQRSKKRSIAVG